MEIERKYLIEKEKIPFQPGQYPHRHIEQAYLCTEPVVRVRRDGDSYILTYKSKGLMVREEYNLPLTKEAYCHLLQKTDGRILQKERYVIPLSQCREECAPSQAGADQGLSVELDIFSGDLSGLILAEVEFPDQASAKAFLPPAWFGEDVTFSVEYHNSALAQGRTEKP